MFRISAFAILVSCLIGGAAVAQQERGRPADAVITTSGDQTVTADNTVWIGVRNSSAQERIVGKLKVTIDDKEVEVKESDFTTFGNIGGGYYCYIWKPTKAGKFKVEVTPYRGPNKTPGTPVKFNVKVVDSSKD